MSEEATQVEPLEVQETESEAQSSSGDAPADEVRMSQAALDALLAREAAKIKRRVRKEFETKMAQPETKPEPQASVETNDEWRVMAARLEELEARAAAQEAERTFLEETAGIELSDKQKRQARSMQDAEARREFLEDIRKAQQAPEPRGSGYQSPGAPNPVPDADRMADPAKWSADDVRRMREEGTFLKNIEKWRHGLPGGRSGLFPSKAGRSK